MLLLVVAHNTSPQQTNSTGNRCCRRTEHDGNILVDTSTQRLIESRFAVLQFCSFAMHRPDLRKRDTSLLRSG